MSIVRPLAMDKRIVFKPKIDACVYIHTDIIMYDEKEDER